LFSPELALKIPHGQDYEAAAQLVDVENPQQKHKAGIIPSQSRPPPRIPLPHPSRGSAGDPGHGLPVAQKNNLSSWLLVASTWLRQLKDAKVEAGFLGA
jgi:hypothetical protein